MFDVTFVFGSVFCFFDTARVKKTASKTRVLCNRKGLCCFLLGGLSVFDSNYPCLVV